MKKPYYLKVKIIYADMLQFERKICFVRVAYENPQVNMFIPLHDVLSHFYCENEAADIITMDIIENTLYK